jgi:predicted nucleotidyltransferase
VIICAEIMKTTGSVRKKTPKTDRLEEIKDVLLKFLSGEDVKIVLFGSRARGDFVNTSDVDIGIIPGETFDRRKLVLLREYLDNLNSPLKVEVVDLSMVSEDFKQITLKEAMIWKG